MSATEELLASNDRYAKGFDPALADLPSPPARKVAVLCCMDARIDPARALGLELGDAHVLRNAGGVATDDVIRSLLLSQRSLGTTEVMVLHHTDCGMRKVVEDDLVAAIEAETGRRPPLPLALGDLDDGVRATVADLRASPFLVSHAVRGFVYDVATGAVREVASGS